MSAALWVIHIEIILTACRVITGQNGDANAIAHHERELRSLLDYYDRVLLKQDWLAGQVQFAASGTPLYMLIAL